MAEAVEKLRAEANFDVRYYVFFPLPADAGADFTFIACSVVVFAHVSDHYRSWRWP